MLSLPNLLHFTFLLRKKSQGQNNTSSDVVHPANRARWWILFIYLFYYMIKQYLLDN